MPKYLMMFDCGYGQERSVEEHPDQEQADKAAYQLWREHAENNADYSAEELTPELAEEYDFQEELD